MKWCINRIGSLLAACVLSAGVLVAPGCAGNEGSLGITRFATETSPLASSGLAGKLLVGYQGWFGCPGDADGNKLWQHWFTRGNDPRFMMVDLLPATQLLSTSELCDTGLQTNDGNALRLYSAQNPRIVAVHLTWMRDHGIDGAAVQRFVGSLADPVMHKRVNRVLDNVRHGAEANGRVFYIVYDVSGARPESVISTIRQDWKHLVEDSHITDSPSYLRDHGKPVLQLWGFGFTGPHPGEPAEVAALIDDLRHGRNGLPAVTLIGGVPSSWRTLDGDSRTDPQWASIYRSYDVISPWSVGRFRDASGADLFLKHSVLPDMAEARRAGVRYMPVVFPGFSWHNIMRNRAKSASAELNYAPRDCGKFLWRQVTNAMGAGATTIYGAMFDEMDEGTVLMPTIRTNGGAPQGETVVTLTQDGCNLPDDWYLQVTGKAASYLREGRKPAARLEDAMRK
ncbi:hypothetical protein ACUXAV_003748 [Cupriavidus metallidurans]|jgi:hypothetical protein|uniref:glycoside hydrolase family 71/99-like protein n=1 Tax=Cupriavidus metallidurans TaxID=119219 RepID=UPI0004938A8A|nr:glycoside hydrolase family 71/99-like protein [Cupriavidus metallidurans]KWW39399.1 hypothetical protein AU374_00465 [Cupriavidus metallidurans]MDE4920616.1 glycoside hydrolase family 71/99-like protein [Cupriavidus metallidurans]